MSAIADAFQALRSVMLLQANVERLERNVEGMASDLKGVKDYAASIDTRVARLEGFIDGAAAASAAPRPRLPRK